jgi:pyruvate ferredoxin oxidoreductase alpha subunit
MKDQILMGINGDEASAYATKQVNPDVVAAYPITPQTIIVERFSEYVADGEVDTEFVAVESEHSALSSCVGASAAGARAFTATLSGPINIHNDHSDSMGARDSGWIQIYCENSQEVYDASLEAWKIAEHPQVQLPVMVCLDGFTLSHTMENVFTLPDEVVKKFVGEREFITVKGHAGEAELRLDPETPLSMGPLDLQDYYFEHKLQQVEAMEQALKAIPEVDAEYAKISGRNYGFLETYMMEDAEAALLGLGSTMGTVRYVVDQLRSEGVKAGLIKMRVFRPFPEEALVKAVGDLPVLGILDKAASFGAPGGPLYEEIKTAFYDEAKRPLIKDFIHGLGGRDTSPTLIRGMYEDLLEARRKGEVSEKVSFVGVRQ